MMMFSHYNDKRMGGSGASVNKGVGGYRPTVNWRDITIRKKNVADKQVLSCIIISGVVIIIIGVVLTILGFLVISSQCPFEWLEGSGSCYYFAQHNASWESGKEYCEEQGATLLDLHSNDEETFIVGKMVGRSWLGLYRKKGETNFMWVSGSKLNFTQGEVSQAMDSPASTRECGVIDDNGKWVVAAGCNDKDSAYVICEYVPGYNPFVLIGPVVMLCGLVLLLLSIEVCVRRRDFLQNNPEVMINEDDDDRQVDAGLINYGYGNYDGDEDDPASAPTGAPAPTKTLSWPPVGSSSPAKSQKAEPPKQGTSSSGVIRQVSPVKDTGNGPTVQVVPASMPNSPSLATVPPHEENTQSQEQLELLLSPKTLE